jgi:phosphoribosylformylglycinamidine synthase
MKAKIFVTLKREVLDPQGNAVRRSLTSLGFEEVKSARVGKLIELELEGDDRASAEAHIQSMCEKLLANPVIEDFRYEIAD